MAMGHKVPASARRSAQSVLGRLQDLLEADPAVDAVRRWVVEVGVEEAEARAAGQQLLADPGDQRLGVTAAALLWRCVDRADTPAVRGATADADEAGRFALHLVDQKSACGALHEGSPDLVRRPRVVAYLGGEGVQPGYEPVGVACLKL